MNCLLNLTIFIQVATIQYDIVPKYKAHTVKIPTTKIYDYENDFYYPIAYITALSEMYDNKDRKSNHITAICTCTKWTNDEWFYLRHEPMFKIKNHHL